MKIFIIAILTVLTLSLGIAKKPNCLMNLDICRAACHRAGDPGGECILRCYAEADKCDATNNL